MFFNIGINLPIWQNPNDEIPQSVSDNEYDKASSGYENRNNDIGGNLQEKSEQESEFEITQIISEQSVSEPIEGSLRIDGYFLDEIDKEQAVEITEYYLDKYQSEYRVKIGINHYKNKVDYNKVMSHDFSNISETNLEELPQPLFVLSVRNSDSIYATFAGEKIAESN